MQKIGLVLAGGGGKGPYQIGVWRALEQFGVANHIKAVSGTSVGALNASLFVQGDLNKAEQAWLSMQPSDILDVDVKSASQFIFKLANTDISKMLLKLITRQRISGMCKRDGLLSIIRNYLNSATVINSNIPSYACATSLNPFHSKYFALQQHSHEDIERILLASSAIPGVFPTEKIDGKQYYDGFILDNTPITPLVKQGCNIILVVMLSRSDLLPVKDFPGCKIIPIYPDDPQAAPLNFKNTAEKMRRGYVDAVRILKPVFELDDTNYEYAMQLEKYKLQEAQYQRFSKQSEQTSAQINDSRSQLLEEIDKW